MLLAGQNIVGTNNDSAYVTAAELANAGARVSLLDARTTIGEDLMQIAGDASVHVHTGSAPLNANGRKGVGSIEIAESTASGWSAQGNRACDLLLVPAAGRPWCT